MRLRLRSWQAGIIVAGGLAVLSACAAPVPRPPQAPARVAPIVSPPVVGWYVGAEALETLDELAWQRLRGAGARLLVVEAAHPEAGVYFPTSRAPVLQNHLGPFVERAHRQEMSVWAAVSLRRMEWIDPAWEWWDWRYDRPSGLLLRGDRLDLMHPAVADYLLGLLTDLAATGIEGVLLVAEPVAGDAEGFSPPALSRYQREMGQALDPARLQLDQDRSLGYAPEFWRWIGWKQRAQWKVVDGLLQALRKSYPRLKVAVEVHPEALSNPRAALAWYAEDLLDLKRYPIDYLVLPYGPALNPSLRRQAEYVDARRLVFFVTSPPSTTAAPVIPEGTGVIYKDRPGSGGLTNRGG